MGFLDKAKAAAGDLAAKADSALGSVAGGSSGPRPGEVDRYLRDLGLLTYLEATGRPADAGERARVTEAIRGLEAAGGLGSHALHTAPPPAPGVAAAGATAPPPPGAATPPPGPAAPPSSPAPAPPPPPSWARQDGDA